MSFTKGETCLEVEESIADVLEGNAPARLVEHISDCDHCRDLKYEAEQAALAVEATGADFHPTAGFAERLVGLVLEQRPEGPQPSMSQSSILPRTSTVTAVSPGAQAARAESPSRAEMVNAPTEFAPTTDRVIDSHATILEPPRFEDVGESPKPAPLPDPPPPSEIEQGRAAQAPETIADPFVPTHKTVPLSAVLRPESSAPAVVEATTGRNNTGPRGTVNDTGSAPARATEPSAQPSTAREPQLVSHKRSATAAAPTSNVRSLFRRKGFIAALAGGMAAAAAVGGFLIKGKGPSEQQVATNEGAWTGSVLSVARASSDGGVGFEVCKETCQPGAQGVAIEAGSTLKTDAKTRARVKLADETWIALDRNTELTLPAGTTRQAKLTRGMIVADVKPVDGAQPAKILLPHGEVSVSDTKVAFTVTERRSAVEVVRGEAEVASQAGTVSKVRAGEEATIAEQGEAVVASKSTMSDVLEWSSESADNVDAPALKGVGELRAKKPGKTEELTGAVKLTKHSVKVRVVDVIARTEIDETFTNQTGDVLEGIFRFPLPPGAQIENLALEVDGQMLDGAFVDRDRGAAIWRGAIQNAAPKAPKPREEIVWVAGPWKDPALLEWQRGGRFELRIFPIPAKGSRRVKLTYTQPVPQSGGVRRFTYPLAHDASGSTKIDDFSVDVQILGADPSFGIEQRGYALKEVEGTMGSGNSSGGKRFTLDEKNFVPAGDLSIEYALPNRNSELTSWAYDMPASVSKTTTQATPAGGAAPSIATPSNLAQGGKRDAKQKEKDAALEAKALVDDGSAYVAFAVRPKLPRFPEGKERLHVIVVDSSRSMVGERFSRATHLAAGIVREMDRRDQFMVLACDVTCQAMGTDASRSLPLPSEPSAEAAGQVESFLGSIEPDGGSNLLTAVKAARAVAGGQNRELRILYLGDGTPTVGPTKMATLESAVRHELPNGLGSVVAVALGADADTTSLAAMARGGNGVVVPYVPGQRVNAAAVDVLAAAYGSILSDVEVVMPAGLAEVTPKRLDPIPAGGESFVLARMTNGKQVEGDFILRGRIGSERFEQKYPAKVVASSSGGNAFVPRLFAAAKISELEQIGAADDRERIVALSKQFNVASRHTSLLVLESEAMFKAFGLEKNGIKTGFTGEDRADSQSADVDGEESAGADDEKERAEEGKNDKKGKARDQGFPSPDSLFDAPNEPSLAGGGSGRASKDSGGFAAPPPAATAGPKAAESAPMAPAKKPSNFDPSDPFSPGWNQQPASRPRRPPNMIPMRRIFERKASFSTQNLLASQVATSLADAETASKSSPDSRDKTVALYKALMASGRVGEALELTARWSQRDALDPDALLARADLAAMNGDRERAMRILSGLADVRPGDKTVQKRLTNAFVQMGLPDMACQHRLSLADLTPDDVSAVASAVRCAQDQGLSNVSQTMLASVRSDLRDKIETSSRTLKLNDVPSLLGDVRVTATWNSPVDLDLAIVDKNGKRLSWLGSTLANVNVFANNATSTSTETLAFSGLNSGTFAVEIVRAKGDKSSTPISGELTFTFPGGEARKVPFTLTGSRVTAGSMNVFFTSRLVPVNGGGGGWRGGF